MKYVSIGEAADLLGVATSTLRNWDRAGILVPERRLSSGKRYYSMRQIENMEIKMQTSKEGD